MMPRPQIFLLLYSIFIPVNSVKFQPFIPTENYKCGVFLQNSVNDEAMHYYYGWINHFIRLLSKPFPHQGYIVNLEKKIKMDYRSFEPTSSHGRSTIMARFINTQISNGKHYFFINKTFNFFIMIHVFSGYNMNNGGLFLH